MHGNSYAAHAGKHSYSRVREAFEILAAGAPDVAMALVNIAVYGKDERARVQAATAVLDRIGLPAQVDVGITATHLVGAPEGPKGQAVDTVRARLALLGTAAQEAEDEAGGVVLSFPSSTIKGEVVDENE